ncbi:MAG: type II toxin-antitoxin system prevent-host-death family antitoxin [Terricaulis sp.]|jgi:prevent-host-death family protein
MIKVNVLEAKNRLSELLRAVQAGEEVIIANRGEPVARLVAAAPVAPDEHPRGSAAAVLAWLAANPLPEGSQRTAEEIDADIAAEREAWD